MEGVDCERKIMVCRLKPFKQSASLDLPTEGMRPPSFAEVRVQIYS